MKATTGRPAIYGPKDSKKKIQIAALTSKGAKRLEKARKELKKKADWPGTVSDADTVEFLLEQYAEQAKG